VAVYLLTVHAYRSWSEDNPLGYVQRDEGLKEPSKDLADWRAEQAKQPESRFERGAQDVLQQVMVAIAREHQLTLHACATCPTHVHGLISFRNPACECGASDFCASDCNAREHAERFAARLKRKMGLGVAKHEGTFGRKWFSRGWDLTPVRKQEHFTYLVEEYLPDHQATQAGIFRRYS
jgi:hypothetical protein